MIPLHNRTLYADGTVICSQAALIELLYRDEDITGLYCDSPDDEQEWLNAIKICDDSHHGPVHITQPVFTDIHWRDNWLTPEPYSQIDVLSWCLEKCTTEQEQHRVQEEILEMQQRNMLPLIRHLIYCVDVWRQAGIVWGVGRGSSVCSFVLFLVGINRINPIEHDLDLKEWLKPQ
jgi:hypothetical protein